MITHIPPLSSRSGLRLAGGLALIVAALVGYKVWLSGAAPHSLHDDPEDYAALALGHGINIDFWMERFPEHSVGYFQTTHPGVFLQLLSGALYQATHEPGETAAARAAATIRDPSSFWAADRLAAVVIFLATLCAIFAMTWRTHGASSLLVPLAMLAYAPAWAYHLEQLGEETFALPLFFALWLALRRALEPRLRPTAFFVAGVAAGLPYLNKLNYVAWLVAAGSALAFYALRSQAPLAQKAKALGAFALGAGTSIVIVGVAILGRDGLRWTFQTHLAVLLNTGHFGLGDPGVVKPALALQNLRSFLSQDWLFSLWLVAILALLVAIRPWRARSPEDSAPARLAEQAMLLFLGSAFLLGFLAAMKHYFPRYLVPALVTIPFALLAVRDRLRPAAILALIGVTVLLDVRVLLTERERVLAAERTSRAYAAEAQRVRTQPRLPGGLRIWTYKALAPEYSAAFILDNAGHNELLGYVYGTQFPGEIGLFKFSTDVPWNYVVVTRDAFLLLPDVSALTALAEIAFEGQHLVLLKRKGI